MTQSKKRKKIESKVVEPVTGTETVGGGSRKKTGFIIASVVLVLVLAIVGIGYYFSEDAKYNRLTIITVDDISIKTPYFLKRARAAGSDAMSMLEQLTQEQIIKIEAPQYVGEVSDEDIDEGLRLVASDGTGNITDDEFKEWYRQQLNDSNLSDAEYREIIGLSLLSARLHEYLAERVSTVAEQAHIHLILLETYEDAVEVRERWEAGEDFADLAREVSLDTESGENGGDIGWFPRGVLASSLEYTAFNLEIDQVSQPQLYTSEYDTEEIYYYLLLMVSETSDARELDDYSYQVLQSQALDTWLSVEAQYHDIKYNYTSEIDAWLSWQLAKD